MPASEVITRSWLSSLLPVVVLACAMQMHGQALTTASGGGSYVSVGGGLAAMQAVYGQQLLTGGMLYVDSNLTPRVGLECEARLLRWNSGEDVTESSYLAGLRIATSDRRLQPYGKVLFGVGRISYPFHYATGSYLAIAPGAGLDYQLGGRWAVRIVDVEYQQWTHFTYGGMHPYGVSSGISFRVTGVELFPKKMRHRH
jgi:hypothetical protein